MKKQINEIKRMQLFAGVITESEYRKSLVNEEMSKEDIMNKISKLKDFEDTEDNFKYGDHFVQKYGNDYAVWKDRGDATGSDPNPDFESSNIAKVVDFLMKKTNESSSNMDEAKKKKSSSSSGLITFDQLKQAVFQEYGFEDDEDVIEAFEEVNNLDGLVMLLDDLGYNDEEAYEFIIKAILK